MNLTQSIELLESVSEGKTDKNSPKGRILAFARTLQRNYGLIRKKSEPGMRVRGIQDTPEGQLRRLAKTEYSAISREMAELRPLFTDRARTQLRADFNALADQMSASDSERFMRLLQSIQQALGGRVAMRAVSNGYPPPRIYNPNILAGTVSSLLQMTKGL